jgi:hypothetical protein
MPRPANEISADLDKSLGDAVVMQAAAGARQEVATYLRGRADGAIAEAEAAVAAGRARVGTGNLEGAEAEVARAKSALAQAAVYTQGTGSELANLKDEWKECRSSIDRFDKALVDLRKTGFGFITAIIAGAAFLLKPESAAAPAANTQAARAVPSLVELPLVRLSIFVVFVLLIIGVFLIDRAHQIWLGVAVRRAEYLEGLLSFRITRNISGKFKGWEALLLAVLIYVGLIVMNGFVFLMSFEPSGKFDLSLSSSQRFVGYVSGGAILFMFVIILGTWFYGKIQPDQQ